MEHAPCEALIGINRQRLAALQLLVNALPIVEGESNTEMKPLGGQRKVIAQHIEDGGLALTCTTGNAE